MTFLENFCYNKCMGNQRGRPPKAEGQRKDKDLRIPVTLEQRTSVHRAAELMGEDMAAWVRAIVLKETEKVLAKHGEPGNRTHRA